MNEIKVIKKAYKSGQGSYIGMFMDLGYAVVPISYDSKQVAEYLGISVRDLYDLASTRNNDDILYVASVQFKPYEKIQGLIDKSIKKGD